MAAAALGMGERAAAITSCGGCQKMQAVDALGIVEKVVIQQFIQAPYTETNCMITLQCQPLQS
jgi:hypothetical protein